VVDPVHAAPDLDEGRGSFSQGRPGGELYLTPSGSIQLVDVGVTIGPGSVFGEIGIFAPSRQRMDTAICESEAEVGVIDNDKVLQLYHQNPKFGFYLIKLVIQRLQDDYMKFHDRPLPAKGLAAPRQPASSAEQPG
jgi:CRP-like cAMP-binding protein